MPLCYAMQCNALQGAVPELSFLAKPHQPSGHDDQMILVDPLEGDKSDTPTTHGHPWHGLGPSLPMTKTLATTMALIATALVTTALTSGPGVLCMWVTTELLSKIARLATIVASSS